MRIRLRVESVTFTATGPYITFAEPYQDNPDALTCDLKILIPEKTTQEWLMLLGKEVLFERVSPLHPSGHPPLPDPDPRDGTD